PVAERSPGSVEPRAHHLEQPAHVRWFCAVEEVRGFGGVPVRSSVALEHAESNQRVEEIPRAARMEAETLPEGFRLERPLRERREDAELDGAEQHLRAPECRAELENAVGTQIRHGGSLR